jgi:hypothetical protein
MISLVLIQTCLVATIFYLAQKSSSQNGIVSIPQESTLSISSYFSISNIWIYGLLWKTLPTQIMTILEHVRFNRSFSPAGASPQFTSFMPNSSISFHPSLYYLLKTTLQRYTFFDASDTIYSDAFGFAVYRYAQAQNPASPITPDLIKNCTQDLWQTLYAGLAVQTLLQNNDAPTAGSGNLSTPVTRLYVVTPIAYTIAAVLALALVCNVWLLYYT